MKTFSCLILIAFVLTITSCSKKNNTPTSYGSWSMKGVNYTVKNCGFVDGVMYATDGSADTLFIIFANSVPPATTGVYQMQFTNPGPGQASVQAYFHGRYYLPQNSTEYIQATVANGKVSTNGTNIHIADPGTPTDVATVTFNITQQ